MSRFRPPLPSERLKELARIRRNDRDFMEVLWYVARLQSVGRRAYQLIRSMAIGPGGGIDLVARCLRDELEEEHFIREDNARRAEILEEHVSPRSHLGQIQQADAKKPAPSKKAS